jgi:hypothetical protein
VKKVSFVLLIFVGLMNFIPIIGVISAEQLTELYGVSIDSADLETLLRHRAVMLGLVGGFLLLAAFRPSLRMPAVSIGLVSMVTFVFLSYTTGDVGAEINKIAIADIVGSIAAAVILAVELRNKGNFP